MLFNTNTDYNGNLKSLRKLHPVLFSEFRAAISCFKEEKKKISLFAFSVLPLCLPQLSLEAHWDLSVKNLLLCSRGYFSLHLNTSPVHCWLSLILSPMFSFPLDFLKHSTQSSQLWTHVNICILLLHYLPGLARENLIPLKCSYWCY